MMHFYLGNRMIGYVKCLLILFLSCGALISNTSVNADADIPEFSLYEDNPLFNTVGITRAIKVGDTYRFYYINWAPNDGDRWDIYVKTSEDGINWENLGSEPIICQEDTGQNTNQSIFELKIGDTYHAWIAASHRSWGNHDIYYASSDDGINYTVHGIVILHGDDCRVHHPWVVSVSGIYHMYYSVGCSNPFGIGHAISSDGINWTKQNNVIGVEPAVNDNIFVMFPMVHYNGSYFEMFYITTVAGAVEIKYAVSSDGYDWTKIGKVDTLPYNAMPCGLDHSLGYYNMWFSIDRDVSLAIEDHGVKPSVDAGENINIFSNELNSTVIIGSASDQDGDLLQYQWLLEESEGQDGVDYFELTSWHDLEADGSAPLSLDDVAYLFGIGQYTLRLAVRDSEFSATDDMILTVGNSAPTAAPQGTGTYEIGSDIVLSGQVSDYDGDMLLYQWLYGSTVFNEGMIQAEPEGTPVGLTPTTISTMPLGLGQHEINLKVDDQLNDPVVAPIYVTVVDTNVPVLVPTTEQTILWPPNHRMVTVVIDANASDNSGGVTLSAVVSSSEPVNGTGDGDTAPDWENLVIDNTTGTITVDLRAERSGRGRGRIYTIMITAMDSSGNSSTAYVNIQVPHNRGKAKK